MKKLLIVLFVLFIIVSCEDNSEELYEYSNIKTLELKIGGWDMDKDTYHSVPIMGDFSIHDIKEMIISEAWIVSEKDNSITNLFTYCDDTESFNGQMYFTDNSVELVRNGNSPYNSEDYDNGDINRGTLIIKYR